MIDATQKGCPARFINHSCAANCATQKWLVNGDVCVCIFAEKDIARGEELTYNYNLEWNGGKRVTCTCGAPTCFGYLGAESQAFRVAEQDAATGSGQWWDDGGGMQYQMDDLDNFDSDDEDARAARFPSAAAAPMPAPVKGRAAGVLKLGKPPAPAGPGEPRRRGRPPASAAVSTSRRDGKQGAGSAAVAASSDVQRSGKPVAAEAPAAAALRKRDRPLKQSRAEHRAAGRARRPLRTPAPERTDVALDMFDSSDDEREARLCREAATAALCNVVVGHGKAISRGSDSGSSPPQLIPTALILSKLESEESVVTGVPIWEAGVQVVLNLGMGAG